MVDAKLKQLQYLPAEVCSDSEFIRRVTLDVTGLLPSLEETREFLASSDPQKRARLVDRLLERPEYAKFWALKWGDWLRLTGKRIGDEAIYKYHRWIENALAENMPYDKFATELLAASGSTLSNPPANFIAQPATCTSASKHSRNCSWCACPMRQVPQSSFRTLDTRQLLWTGCVLRPRPTQENRSPGRDVCIRQ